MNKKKIFIISAIGGLILLTIGANYFLFGNVSIKSNVNDINANLNDKDIQLPYKSFLRTGKYQLKTNITGYLPTEQTLDVKPGQNNFTVELQSYEQVFIESLPIENEAYLIEYNENENFFYILIKSEPADDIKAKALKYITYKNVDTGKIEIVWDYVAGINGRSGP